MEEPVEEDIVKKEEINRVQTENYADSSFSKTPAI
jgi:hypothetical protein